MTFKRQKMGQYGVTAVEATKMCNGNLSLSPCDAWVTAISAVSKSLTSIGKSCPKCAYFGLCEAGVVSNIKAGVYNKKEDNINKSYVLGGYELIKKGFVKRGDPLNRDILRKEVMGDMADNQQMDVLVSLWEADCLIF